MQLTTWLSLSLFREKFGFGLLMVGGLMVQNLLIQSTGGGYEFTLELFIVIQKQVYNNF